MNLHSIKEGEGGRRRGGGGRECFHTVDQVAHVTECGTMSDYIQLHWTAVIHVAQMHWKNAQKSDCNIANQMM